MLVWDWLFAILLLVAIVVGYLVNLLKPPSWLHKRHVVTALIVLLLIYAGGAVYLRINDRSLAAAPTPNMATTIASPPSGFSPTAQAASQSQGSQPAASPCHALRSAALNEEAALRRLRNAVIINENSGSIDGPGADYSSIFLAARSAVDTAYQKLAGFQQAGGKLPVLGGGDVDYERDIGNLSDFELTRVNDGVTRSAAYDEASDYSAWNQLKVYADNAHLVGTMQCS